MSIWSVLDIEPTDDLSIIKRAYARKLKTTRPDQDPEGYQRLREAFEQAKGYVDRPSRSDVVTEILDESPSFTLRMPVHIEPLKELTPDIDDALEQELEALRPVTVIIDLMMEDETEGLNLLKTVLSAELWQNLRLRELFSQELAAQLSEREGLYSALLIRVSEVMGWDIDHYQPGGIPAHRLAALYRQIENTEAEVYWEKLKRRYHDTELNRKRFRLMTAANTKLPWWTKWEPVFLKPLHAELNRILWDFPLLLPRINPELVKAHSQNGWMMNWGTIFLTAFWGILIVLGTRDDPNQFRDRCILTVVIGSFIYGYDICKHIFRNKSKAIVVVESVLSAVTIGVLVKIFLGLSGLFTAHLVDPHFKIFFGLLCLISFICLCVMGTKKWRWYNTPFNGMILLLTFPWKMVKIDGWLYGIVICILMLLAYSLLVALALK